jgi:hypothetical protein
MAAKPKDTPLPGLEADLFFCYGRSKNWLNRVARVNESKRNTTRESIAGSAD